jgi:PAS domain S-box-containing protein
VLYVGLVLALLLAGYQCYRKFNFSTVMMMLAMPAFAVLIQALQYDIVELAIFSGFAAKAFLILTFEAAKYQEGKNSSMFRLESKLSLSEENFYRLFSMLPDPAVIVDSHGNFVDITSSVTKVIGFTREDLVGTSFFGTNFISSESKKTLMENLNMRISGYDLKPYEIEIISKEGKVFTFEVNASKIDYKGDAAVVVAFRDLTERKKFMQDLEVKEERFRDIADSTGDWIWEVDQNGKYIYSNSVGEKILGYTLDEIYDRNYNDFISPDQDHGDFLSHMEQSSNGVWVKKSRDKSGKKVYLESRGVPIVGVNGSIKGYRGVDRDITEKMLLEERLVRSERFAAIGQLATMVAHDLRNPLQSIATAAYVLKRAGSHGEDSRATRMIQNIESSVSYSERIVRDLLEFSADINLNLEVSNPNSIVEAALSTLVVPESVRIVDLTNSEPGLPLDINKFTRVCVNLIQNSIDAMPSGGTLTVSSGQVGDCLELVFADTGLGISKENIAKLMTPFFTTKAKGMGLGLAISKRIIEAHGGSIVIDSEIGRGSTFKLVMSLSHSNEKSVLLPASPLNTR